MLRQKSIKAVVVPDLSDASLLVVLMQLRVVTYLRDRIDQIFPASWMPRLLKQRVKASKQIPGLMTGLTEAHEMAIVGGVSTLKSYVGLNYTTTNNYSFVIPRGRETIGQ